MTHFLILLSSRWIKIQAVLVFYSNWIWLGEKRNVATFAWFTLQRKQTTAVMACHNSQYSDKQSKMHFLNLFFTQRFPQFYVSTHRLIHNLWVHKPIYAFPFFICVPYFIRSKYQFSYSFNSRFVLIFNTILTLHTTMHSARLPPTKILWLHSPILD